MLPAVPVACQSAGINAAGSWTAAFYREFSRIVDRPLSKELSCDLEQARRARLVTRFGVLGSLFGLAFASFYMLIGHQWGAVIVLICSFGVAMTPAVMCARKSVSLGGNFLLLVLTLGFTGLCFVEGGLHGHAIAWLVSVPLCALLLLGEKPAGKWAIASFLAAALIAGISLSGKRLPNTYDPAWDNIVSAAGYLGLILFMFILGLIFESGRARAFFKMQEALGELAASNERLLHLNNEKNEFLGIAAHDLKNPLTVISGCAELLGMSRDPERVAKLSTSIVGASKRMRDLITNLLDANAIEQGRFTSNIERCDLNALVAQSVENNLPAANKKEISMRVGNSDPLWARADKAAVLQVLDNLVSNALKYSPPKTIVHVHTLPERERVVVSVRDEGPGISEADQKKLFQKFSRLSARPTGGESSTGLGLSIVKRLAEAMGGSVSCSSTLGSGSTFTFRLPVWPREDMTPERSILSFRDREQGDRLNSTPSVSSKN